MIIIVVIIINAKKQRKSSWHADKSSYLLSLHNLVPTIKKKNRNMAFKLKLRRCITVATSCRHHR